MSNNTTLNSRTEDERRYIESLIQKQKTGEIDRFQVLKKFSEWKGQEHLENK